MQPEVGFELLVAQGVKERGTRFQALVFEFGNVRPALGRELELERPPVGGVGFSDYVAVLDQPVDELGGGAGGNIELFRDLFDSDVVALFDDRQDKELGVSDG